MMRSGIGWLIAGSVLMTALPAAADVEYVCRIGETVRRIEIRYAGDVGRPPCEVVYTKETERPGVEETLWSATADADFCRSKAEGLVDLLEENRWSCSGDRPSAGGQAARAAASPAGQASRDQAAGEGQATPRAETPPPPPERPDVSVAEVAPAAAPAESDDRDDAVDELNQQAALPADGEAASEEPGGAGGVLVPVEALEAAIERDLARLKKSADDAVEATVGSFGDLNGDDVEDAAVLITFDADGADHAQYLVAYVAEDETFRPAASRFIGGRYRKVFGADVAGIEQGRIRLELKVLQPEDAYCCPSGAESAQFVLENGELVDAP